MQDPPRYEVIARNGRRFVVDGIGIFGFDPGDDRILGEKVVSDMLALVRQLGGDLSLGAGR
jgi:hypothetical protein